MNHRTKATALLSAVATLAAAGSASAATSGSIFVDRGTTAEKSGIYVSSFDDTRSFGSQLQARLIVTRGTAVVVDRTGAGPFVEAFGVVAQTGDVITVEQPAGKVAFVETFDGRPTVAACAGDTVASGARTSGAQVFASVRSPGAHGSNDTGRQRGTIGSPAADTYTATFARPLNAGQVLQITTDVEKPNLFLGSSLTVPVAACPPPAAPGAPPAAVVPPDAKPLPDTASPVAKLVLASKALRLAVQGLFRNGTFATKITVNEPGTVSQKLFVRDGKLPASAAAAKKRGATLVGSGSAVAKAPGTVRVTIRATKAGKKKLKSIRRKRTVKLALVTTVVDTAGNTRTLPVKTFTAKR